MPRARSRPQQSRSLATRRRLLDTALQLLERTPGALTTQALADAAHVSVGTVYRYFADRDAILAELLEATVRDVYNALATTVGGALDRDLDAAMLLVVDGLTSTFEGHAAVLRAFGDQGLDSDLWRGVEQTLFALARVIPARHRPDLTPAELDDLVFVSMGFTATGCLRIALHRPPGSDRDAMVAVTARMLAAALRPAG